MNAEDAKNLADAQIGRHAVETLQQFRAADLDTPFFLAVGFHRYDTIRSTTAHPHMPLQLQLI